MVSLGNIWTMIWSRIFFREPITRFKIAGLLLILIGVFFIGLGNS
jgi:drug/metabolite transporter (DMT)-like permease